MLKSVVWQERYKCNFKCPYCEVIRRPQPDLPTWEKWVSAFNRIRPQVLDITGGEPFLNKNIVDIINGLSDQTAIGITSNLSQDIQRYADEVSPKKVISMTASYHPSQKDLTREMFLGKVLLLMSRGFHVTVNFVAYPQQMFLIPGLAKYFQSHGIRFHVDPFAEEGNELHKYTDQERKFLAPYVGSDRDQRITDKPADRFVNCSGGRDYIQVDPAGNAYRCMTYQFQNIAPFGNILDENFKLYETDTFCSMGHLCGGCDKDKVKKTTVKDPALCSA